MSISEKIAIAGVIVLGCIGVGIKAKILYRIVKQEWIGLLEFRRREKARYEERRRELQ